MSAGDDTATVCSGSRLIMYHKQATSAMVRFLRFADGGICAFEPLPALSQVLDSELQDARNVVSAHPASLLSQAEHWLGLAPGSLELDRQFRVLVDMPGGAQQVFLVRFTTIDPPHEQAERVGGRFIVLTEARNLPRTELDLLGRAYKAIMEG